MPTASPNINEVEHSWGDLLRSLFDLFGRYGRPRARRTLKPVNAWEDDPRMQEAISAVRMAAYPGEDYEDVANRIDRELARYREFVRNPTPIGKITLNTKKITSAGLGGDPAGDKYQVCDPAGGRAAVFYSVDRSPNLVLEFIVHDQNDVQLFPIVRTYSDWLGRKSFDLGAGRTFDLHMSEDECPAKVRVHARVASADAARRADPDLCFAGGGLPLAAGDDGDRGKAKGASGWSYGSRITLAFAVECLILFAFGWSFLSPSETARTPAPDARAAAVDTEAATLPGVSVTLRDDATRFLIMDGEAPFSWRAVGLNAASAPSARGAQRSRDGDKRGLTRIAAVSGGRVKMDESFCRSVGELCSEWRAIMQSALDAVNGMPARRAGATAVAARRPGPEAVLVSYPTADADSGQVHVTLLLADAFFLLRGTDCVDFGGGGGAKVLADATSPVTGSDMCKGVESKGQPTGGNSAGTPEGKMKSLDAE